MNNKKTFGQVRPGDTIYKVCIYNYKTRIIKKTVKTVTFNIDKGTIKIKFKCKDSEYYQNIFPKILFDTSIHLAVYTPNTYLCTNIEDAKIACNRLATEIVSNTEKQISKLSERVSKWRMHQEELVRGNYIIK